MFRKALVASLAIAALSHPLPAQTTPHTASSAPNAQTPAWELALQQRREELIHLNGLGTDVPLRNQLLKMRDEDQAARGFTNGQRTSAMTKELIQKLPATDTRLTQELKQIVDQKGWPTIALVGIDASNGAMLILTHTPDHAWQRELLPQLQTLAAAGKIDGSSLALVVDKELVAEGKLQRYGSQFKFINGKMAMYAVEDPSTLNQRRAQALLPPMDIYKEFLAQMYHLQASDDVVMATAPAKK